MRTLIVYGTTDGHTRKIARHVADRLRAAGREVELLDSAALPLDFSILDYDVYLLAGSIHVGKHQRRLQEFVEAYLPRLNQAPSAFVSVSAAAASPDEPGRMGAVKCMNEFLEQVGWKPTMTATVAGAILYRQYSFWVRMMMRSICKRAGGPTDTSRDHELTDWNALDAFTDRFAETCLVPCPA